MFSVHWETDPAYSPIVWNIENAALKFIDLNSPGILPLVKPDQAHLSGVEGRGDHVDVVVPESEHRLVRVDPAVWGERIANIIQLGLQEGGVMRDFN